MNYHIDIQHACEESIPVTDNTLDQWITQVLAPFQDTAELTLRFVAIDEMVRLNHTYRKQNKPTNVLAFSANLPPNHGLDIPLLGDVVICPAVLEEESQSLKKPLIAHWAHIVIHGVLHLLGYDHMEEHDARIMQKLETDLLLQLGFNDPYFVEEDEFHER